MLHQKLTCSPLELQPAALDIKIGVSAHFEQKRRSKCMRATRSDAQEVTQMRILSTVSTCISTASRHSWHPQQEDVRWPQPLMLSPRPSHS